YAVLADVDLEEVGAVDDGLTAVEPDPRDPDLLARVEQGHPARVGRRHRTDPHRTVGAVVFSAVGVVLQPAEQRVGVGRLPAGRTVLHRPLVEVLARGPERDAGVVRRAAAEHAGAGMTHERVAVLLLLDRVVPVIAGLQ